MVKNARLCAVLAAAALALSACSTGSGDGADAPGGLKRMVLVTNFSAVADHAPYFVARDKGYYKEVGLDVDIQFGKGSADSAQRVGNGQADISIVDTGTAITAMGNGAEATIIGMLFDKSAHAVWTTPDAGIKTINDLVGKKVGVPSTDTQYVLFPALAKANDIDPASITFVNVASTGKYAALGSGKVDAIFDYSTGQPFVEQATGAGKAVSLPWAEYGVNLYNNSLVGNNAWLAENPEFAKKFLQATYKGWQYSLENPEEAVSTMKKAVPTIDTKTFQANFALGAELFKTKTYAERGLGYIDPDKMCQTVKIVTEYIKMAKTPACDDVYTNDHLPNPPVELPASLRP